MEPPPLPACPQSLLHYIIKSKKLLFFCKSLYTVEDFIRDFFNIIIKRS